MKTQSIRHLVASLGLACALHATSSQAAAFIKFDGVDGETLGGVEEALLDIQAQAPKPVALLLPAVQKVREAARRASYGCSIDERTVESDCYAVVLRDAILASRRNPDRLGLWNLASRGLQLPNHRLEAFLRSIGARGSDTLQATEDLLSGLLAGLYVAVVESGLEGDETSGAIDAIIREIDALTAAPAAALVLGYDVKRHPRR